MKGILVIALTPEYPFPTGTPQANLNTIRFVQSLGIVSPVNMLEAEGGYNIYLGNNFHRIAESDKKEDFTQFLRSRSLNMIVLSDNLMRDSRFKDDHEWGNFLTDFPRLGYREIIIQNTGRKLIIKSDLL